MTSLACTRCGHEPAHHMGVELQKVGVCADYAEAAEHEYVDRIIRMGGWYQATKLVIYCKRCGHVSVERFIG